MTTFSRKISLLLLAVMLLLVPSVQAQKYACVNVDMVLRSIPDYNQVLNRLNRYTAEWQEELEAKQQEIDLLRQDYQQEAYLLPDNLKQRRQAEITTKETELRALQRQYFGPGGELEQKRAELMKPVQDRVNNAIERVAREKNYAFVFDKSVAGTIVYVSDKYDISNQVLEILGVKAGSAAAASTGSGTPASAGSSASKAGTGANHGGAPKRQPSTIGRDMK